MLEALRWLTLGFGIYLVLGVFFALPFVFRGAQRVDDAATGTGWAFRLLIVPGCALLWPLLLRRWLHAARPSSGLSELPTDDGLRHASELTAATAASESTVGAGEDRAP